MNESYIITIKKKISSPQTPTRKITVYEQTVSDLNLPVIIAFINQEGATMTRVNRADRLDGAILKANMGGK